MGLEAVEHALARLYTDDRARERFFANPASEGAALGLSTDEVDAVLAMDRSRIDLFAEQLRLKRFNEILRLLPRATAAIGADRVRASFLSFAASFVPQGLHKHHADAMAFARRLSDTLDGDDRDAALFDLAALGLFFRLHFDTALPRRGPSIALARRNGRRFLLVRGRGATRFQAVRFL